MNGNTPKNHAARRILRNACAVVLGAAFGLSPPGAAQAAHVTPPGMPSAIQAPPGSKAFLEGHAVGTQNYICLPSASGPAVTVTPDRPCHFGPLPCRRGEGAEASPLCSQYRICMACIIDTACVSSRRASSSSPTRW